jgi:hypothetical protein
MAAQDGALEQITKWFANVRHAGLILPNGWFGRPHDNQHQLTWAHARRYKLLLELDEQLLLVLTTPGPPIINAEGITMGFDQLVFDWQGYGDLQPHVDVFSAGQLQLVAPTRSEHIT